MNNNVNLFFNSPKHFKSCTVHFFFNQRVYLGCYAPFEGSKYESLDFSDPPCEGGRDPKLEIVHSGTHDLSSHLNSNLHENWHEYS
jgi:hypothetical protein